jgi:hypothetical protein
MQNQNSITSKRFVIRKSLIGKNTVIKVEFKNGKTFDLQSRQSVRSNER